METLLAHDGQILVMRPTGPLVGGPETEELVEKGRAFASTGHAGILLDLAGVPFMNSLALGAISSILATCSRRGSFLMVCALQPRIRSLFDVVKFHKLFEYHESEEPAIAALSRELAPHA